MPGFVTNNESVHQVNSRTGFRNAGKGKRHRWDLSQKAPKPGTSKPKSPKLKAFESPMPEMSMDDGDGLDMEDGMDIASEPAVAHHAPVSVNIHLGAKDHSAFQKMQGSKRRK